MQRTDIEWADFSSNPIKLKLTKSGKSVNFCVLCSKGCTNCYSAAITKRFWPTEEGKFPGFSPKLLTLGTPSIVDAELERMLKFRPRGPFKAGDRPKVFLGDMTDIFGPWVDFAILDRLFAVFALRHDVDWLILTKRPERMAEYLVSRIGKWQLDFPAGHEKEGKSFNFDKPLPNVHLGTSVEDQAAADERIPHLLRCPAKVRFLSCEPLLGEINFRWFPAWHRADRTSTSLRSDAVDARGGPHQSTSELDGLKETDWVIVGGESGHGARPCNIDWIRSIVSQCKAAGVPVFTKQLGSQPVGDYYRERDFYEEHLGAEWPDPFDWDLMDGQPPLGSRVVLPLKDRKGGDINEFPEDLRVREFPSP